MSTRVSGASELAAIRRQIARTDPADLRARVLLVCAHERARRRLPQLPPDPAGRRNERLVKSIRNRSLELSSYGQLVERVKAAVERVVPEEARILVVSRGDDALLDLGSRRTGHFPQAHGRWAGYYPADGAEALVQLEALASEGYDHIVFPATSSWWLEYYEGLAFHLFTHGRVLLHNDDCAIVALRVTHNEGGALLA
jgi:hypothetical protein